MSQDPWAERVVQLEQCALESSGAKDLMECSVCLSDMLQLLCVGHMATVLHEGSILLLEGASVV